MSLKHNQYATRGLNEKSSVMLKSTTSISRMDRELSPKRSFYSKKASTQNDVNTSIDKETTEALLHKLVTEGMEDNDQT